MMQLALDLEAKRLRGQCGLILARLRQGRMSNSEMSRYALKYSSRTSDLRKQGYDVRVVQRDRATGLTHYALFVNGLEV